MNASRSLPRALVALVVAAAFVLSGCTSSSSGSTFRYSSATAIGKLIPVADRKKADNFSGTLLDGGSTKLSSTAGKVVVVNFWASWCGPCQIETPQFDLAYRRMKTEGVTFLGIDFKDAKANAKNFVEQNKISYPMVYDPKGQTALSLGNIPADLPFSVLIDKSGRVAAVYLGGLTDKDIQGPIDKLRAEA